MGATHVLGSGAKWSRSATPPRPGWCNFTALHEQWVAYLDPKGRQEIYDSDGFTADIFFPIGKVDYVDGGVKLSGQWNWGSGVKWDDWIGLGAFVEVAGHGRRTASRAW